MTTSRTAEVTNAQHECLHEHENKKIQENRASRKSYMPPAITNLDTQEVQGGLVSNVLEATASGILTS